jgi:outer membrane protein assembly factor BamB
MRRFIMRAHAVVAAGVVLGIGGVTGASASGAALRAPQALRVSAAATSHAAVSPGTQLWVKRFGNGFAASVAASPTGKVVFVTGQGAEASGYLDYATVAYNAATGAQLWAKSYNDTRHGYSAANSVAVSPDGKTVFVTGLSGLTSAQTGYATVAYNAATGAQLWVKRYNGPANVGGEATSVAVSPTGAMVFVTGCTSNGAGGYATVAYSAATGARLWVKRYLPANNISTVASAVAVSPDGKTVFVTGGSGGPAFSVYATVAYNAATGARLWVKRFNHGTGVAASSLAVSPTGAMVYVAGATFSGTTAYNYATVAYNAATGAQVWVKRYDGPAKSDDEANSVAVSPTGTMVFVTGLSYGGSTTGDDYATVAYNATTGAQLWVKRYIGPGHGGDDAYSVAVSPTGGTVYVTGQSEGANSSFDYATVAYNAATGAQVWVKRYGSANGTDTAKSMAVSPTGTVFVIGNPATIAYSG